MRMALSGEQDRPVVVHDLVDRAGIALPWHSGEVAQ